ncbi:LptF/LptG family permease [Pelagibacteraceae bacterium]|nr:LptF/LptG family permease [Pelagibacteraceae bacterium]
MFKNKLNNYFIAEILRSYAFVLATFSFLIWITQSARFLYLITDMGLSMNVYIPYILYQLPKIVSQMMLISFLISLFISIIKFQNNKEMEIYWLSGISKKEIIWMILKISLVPTIIAFFLYVYLAPMTGLISRNILANSEFSFVNALVKKNNFNSPFNNLTVYVGKNDNQGNLKKVYLFENNKTIIAKQGKVLNTNKKNYLQLIDGFIHEKSENNKITIIKFEKTLYDFTKYQSNIVTTPKFQERSFLWLLTEFKKNKKSNDILFEIHKRLFKPLFIPIVALLCCFILYGNNEKFNLIKLRFLIFSLAISFIIFFEILLNLSASKIFFQYFLYSFPICAIIIIYFFLHKFIQNEPMAK